MAFIVALVIPWMHPLAVLPSLFYCTYTFLFYKEKKRSIIGVACLLLGSAVVKSVFFTSWYDQKKQNAFITQLSEYNIGNSQLHFMFQWDFWPVVLSIVVCTGTCVYLKRYKQLFLYILFVIVYSVLLDVMIKDYSLTFYHEVSYSVLFFTSIYVISSVWRNHSKYMYSILYLLCIMGLLRITISSRFYSDRIAWYKKLLLENDRVIFAYDEKTYPLLIMEWGSPFESLIISSLDNNSKVVLFARNPKDFMTDENDRFLNHFANVPLNHMDNRYFTLDKKEYQINLD